MSARIVLFSAALMFGACATAQENPNYQFSSKYGAADTVQTASAQNAHQIAHQTAQPPAQTITYVTTSRPVAADGADLADVPVTLSMPPIAVVPVSPTEQAYDAPRMTGTPGYSVYVPDDVPAAPGGPQAVAYDYSQNVRAAGAPVMSVAPQTQRALPQSPSSAAQWHTVRQGDTIYSMARQLCVPLEAITAPNGISADFAIDIGQTVQLPASRC